MTTCANCGTTQGPFVRDGGTALCGFPPRYRATAEQKAKRTAECAARRAELDRQRYPGAAA